MFVLCLCVVEGSELAAKSPDTRNARARLGSNTESESSYGGGGGCDEDCSETSSPATATTLRPRFGKEYQRVERRRLVENNVTPSPGPPSTTSSSTVFTFDVTSMASSSRQSFISDCSTDNDSPRSPMLRGHADHPVYMNIGFPNGRSGSPVIVEHRPPSALSYAAEQSNALLNYAEIDLRHTNGKSSSNGESGTPRHKRPQTERVEYAMIDMVATAAASRVGKEHARQREDSLRRKDGAGLRRSDSEGWRRRGNTPTPRTPTNKGGSGSLGKSGNNSKDRKFSSPM